MRTAVERRRRHGFTLLEVIISIALASMIFLAIMGLSGTIIREHLESIRSGQVSAMTLYSLDAMNREIESATHIDPTTLTANRIGFCQDYSAAFDLEGSYKGAFGSAGTFHGAIDNIPANIKTIVYCVDGTNATPSATWWQPSSSGTYDANGNSLWRYEYDGACLLASSYPGCGGAAGTGWTSEKIVDHNIWPADGGPAYFSAPEMGGNQIRIQYIVGHSTPVPNVPTPSYFKGDFQIQLDRQTETELGTPWSSNKKGNTD